MADSRHYAEEKSGGKVSGLRSVGKAVKRCQWTVSSKETDEPIVIWLFVAVNQRLIIYTKQRAVVHVSTRFMFID